MPDSLKALIVLVTMAFIAFATIGPVLVNAGMKRSDLDIRFKSWLALQSAMFLAGNFWAAMIAVAIIGLYARKRDSNPVSLYVFLVLSVPLLTSAVGGLGILGHLVEINHSRLLSAIILLPTAVQIIKSQTEAKVGALATDKFMICYFSLMFLLTLQIGSFFGVVRQAIFYPILDVFTLYFVASRTLNIREKQTDFLLALAFAGGILGLTGIFEITRSWLLFGSLETSLGLEYQTTNYLARDVYIRALTSSGQPIVYGYEMALSLIFALSILFQKKRSKMLLTVAICLGGLISSLSKGPWLGALAGILLLISLSDYKNKVVGPVALLTVVFIVFLATTDAGKSAVEFLPFIGTLDEGSQTYRTELMQVLGNYVLEHPFLGAHDYYFAADTDNLKAGGGFIDVVNTYLIVALQSGFTGLSLFLGCFLSALWFAYLKWKASPKRSEERMFSGTLVASMVCIMITIYTVSNIYTIPILYWSIIGACAALAPRKISRRRINQ
jgi:hypothetical protein